MVPRRTDKELASNRSAFSVNFHGFLWIITTGAQFVIGWWYRKAAVFYLPPGWLGPLAWWMAFPFAPTGGSSFLASPSPTVNGTYVLPQ